MEAGLVVRGARIDAVHEEGGMDQKTAGRPPLCLSVYGGDESVRHGEEGDKGERVD